MDTWLMLREVAQIFPEYEPSTCDGVLMKLATCANQRRMNYEQVLAVVDKYMADHPADWGYEMCFILMNTFVEVCGLRPQ